MSEFLGKLHCQVILSFIIFFFYWGIQLYEKCLNISSGKFASSFPVRFIASGRDWSRDSRTSIEFRLYNRTNFRFRNLGNFSIESQIFYPVKLSNTMRNFHNDNLRRSKVISTRKIVIYFFFKQFFLYLKQVFLK